MVPPSDVVDETLPADQTPLMAAAAVAEGDKEGRESDADDPQTGFDGCSHT